MSALLIDVGNTRVKWARFANARLQKQRAAAHANWKSADFARQVFGAARADVTRVLVASVAGAEVNRALTTAALKVLGVTPKFVATQRQLAGVTTMYLQPWRLGVDRFVAVIGAHQRAPHRAICVIDIGTAMTIDLVDATGRHLGGAIIPGPQLMVESLLKSTSGIRRRSGGKAHGAGLFARDTRAAIGRGAEYAVAAAVDCAIIESRRVFATAPLVLLTGGAAQEIQPLVRGAHTLVPDLVLRGLVALL
jgi:type III pantothenate kinase